MYRFFIWETGKVARRFIIENYKGFFRNNVIIGFVDNYFEKQTS